MSLKNHLMNSVHFLLIFFLFYSVLPPPILFSSALPPLLNFLSDPYCPLAAQPSERVTDEIG